MADKSKKEPTPPPLLLMPAGGGLTLTPPDQPSLFMPVIQSEPSLFGAEEDVLGEADSFVGQSPPPTGPATLDTTPSTSIFSNTPIRSGSDPYLNKDHGSTPLKLPSEHYPAHSTPLQGPGSHSGAHAPSSSRSLTPSSQVPQSGPPSMSTQPPLPNASGLSGLYRKHGSHRYAQMPAGTYAGASPAHLMSNPPAPTPFSPAFSDASRQEPAHNMSIGQPATLPPQPSLGQLPGMGYVQNATGTYVPVAYHWCFCKKVEGRDIWYPMSMADSLALEDALRSAGAENTVVATDGGRYDVNLSERKRYAVFWEEEPKVVQRCSWFYKREGDNRYVPYEEQMANKLEEEYKTAITSGVWHKPIQLHSGETVVMHNPSVMVHYMASSQPDEWGNADGDQMRPRVVKRGVGDFETIDEGESRQVDHLVFVVHGIGMVCDFRFRSIIDCVDDFRDVSKSLLSSHFTEHVDNSRIGRVEFLPVQWHMAVHGDETGIDQRMKAITLQSIGKLRSFINDTVLDVLFYTSPTYAQCIVDTVGKEINRLYDIFLSRHPGFKGAVSVAGHSLGSCILFDILQHQADPVRNGLEQTNGFKEPSPEPVILQETEAEGFDEEDQSQMEESALTLEELLAKVGLQEKIKLFEEEQMDMESLIMCSESDLKDLGLPMGPRRKLQGLLKEEQAKKEKQRQAQERKIKEAEEHKLRQKQQQQQQQQKQQQLQICQEPKDAQQSSSMTIEYLVGTGGTGQANIRYPKLSFSPVCCFALGSPVGLFLSTRGVETIGEEFRLPTCQKYFNIFHPFDPVAYRMEPLISPDLANLKPVQMQHHKGRKRLHLELKESLAKMGADIKQRIIDSLKSTWTSINNFARAHQSDTSQSLEQQVESEMSHITQQLDDDDRSSIASGQDEDVHVGQLNEGRRIDYVLQERPIESFNDYVFSLTSHACYWNSEDTVLMVLKEIYSIYGIAPKIPGVENKSLQKSRVGPPPRGPPSSGPPYGASPTPGLSNSVSLPTGFGSVRTPTQMYTNGPPSRPQPMTMGSNEPLSRPQPMTIGSNLPPPSGPPPFSMGQAPHSTASMGPPPLSGFLKKS